MGITLTQLDLSHARRVARNFGWVVFEASLEKYFGNKKWLRDAVKAEYVLERPEIIFTLKNGDFVRLENTEVN